MARPSAETERRDQILTATCEVIAEQGFRSLRVADVARRIGTATGTVHYYFPTKRDLLHAAFEHNFQRSLGRRKRLLEQDDPIERLQGFLDSYLPTDTETIQAWRVWAELWIEAIHDPELQRLNDTVYGEWRALIVTIIEQGQAQGVLRPGDPVVLANLAIGMIDGLAIQVIIGSRSMDVAAMRRTCARFISDIAVASVASA